MHELPDLRPTGGVEAAEATRLRTAAKQLTQRRCTAWGAGLGLCFTLILSFALVFASELAPNVGRAELFFTSGDSLSRACGLAVRGVPAQPDARRPAFRTLLSANEIRLVCWLHVLNESVPGVDWTEERLKVKQLSDAGNDTSWCGKLVDKSDDTWQTLN